MLLALDIGNSGIKGGIFSSRSLERAFRIADPQTDAEENYRRELQRHLGNVAIERAGIASVVPTLTTVLTSTIEEITGVTPEVLRAGTPGPLQMTYETPDTLGVDRLAAAAAGFARFGRARDRNRPVIVIDAGTAITYEVIDAAGTYLGGMISPGPSLLQDSLVRHTAQLSAVPLELPDHPIGRSTAEAIQSGLMSSCVDGIRGAIERLNAAIPGDPVVVMTGGWTDRLSPHLPEIDHLDPHLVLRGICLLMQHADETNQ